MDFMKALKLVVQVIREQRELDEIYLYEINSQTQVYLKDYEGSLQFMSDEPVPPQIFLAYFYKRSKRTPLSLEVIFSDKWEVRLRKTEHLSAKMANLGKTSEIFIDYTPIGKEEVENV